MKCPTPLRLALCLALAVSADSTLLAQNPAPARAAAFTPPTPPERQRIQQLSNADHADMMRQLGITKLRPGRNPNTGSTNPPNTDEAKANPFPGQGHSRHDGVRAALCRGNDQFIR